jgi:phosphatidylinositol phospholipase C delta
MPRSEDKAVGLAKKQPNEFIEYNTRHVSRIYPRGVRFDSSNYDPLVHFFVGSQFVCFHTRMACFELI